MSFLLDTNICSAVLKFDRRVFSRWTQHGGNLFVSQISLAELYDWAYRSPNASSRIKSLDEFCTAVELLDFDQASAHEFGRLRRDLRNQGLAVKDVDLLIASVALARGLILVSNDQDFRNVPGLQTEDWLQT